MTIPTHVMAGLVVGKFTGNYSLAVFMSVVPDLDHLFSYAKNDILFKFDKFLKAALNPRDPYGDQRYIFHNIIFCILASFLVSLINYQIGVVFALAYLGHILLDSIDSSDYFPFFPNKSINVRGPIGYFSKKEFFVFLILVILFFLI